MTDDDIALLQRLGSIARSTDSVPEDVRQFGRAVFGLRRLDAELAELIEDSLHGLVGVRSGGSDIRMLTFAAGELVVEAQVSGSGAHLSVLGQVHEIAAPQGLVRLERASADDASTELDDLGAFRFDDVAGGTVRFVVDLGEGRSVATSWFSV